jgi:REP element-mobilizing transposase RayT/transcriptional regulator
MDDEDHLKFLEIMDESAKTYNFEVFSYALMDNHYHLLLKTTALNLSLLMRQINSRYSIYFNKKYKRVGPLWQGRFKSWFVYDKSYLKTLVKYIEFNPVKTNISKKAGEFRWTMSSKKDKLDCLNYGLIDIIDLKSYMNEKEIQKIDDFFNAKVDMVNGSIVPKVKKNLELCFKNKSREVGIAFTINEGYTQQEIANYLGLSNVSISIIYKIYREKDKLFKKLRDKGIFWSYSKTMTYEEVGNKLFIEYLYKYGDFDDIELAFTLFGKRVMKSIWEETLVSDRRFKKLNFMIARVFLGMKIEADYFKEVKNARFEKFKMLAS